MTEVHTSAIATNDFTTIDEINSKCNSHSSEQELHLWQTVLHLQSLDWFQNSVQSKNHNLNLNKTLFSQITLTPTLAETWKN